ncbi:hypothetical protein RRG08_053839 [Elysia crispata]|uniref:Uncharacterized protein n=1 Tax=Elysia crispata TaxID=231223 RepID=A0AAE1ABU7_9GAST|nr:hypothetical protein RRG08_053839 [Elysia crispata]
MERKTRSCSPRHWVRGIQGVSLTFSTVSRKGKQGPVRPDIGENKVLFAQTLGERYTGCLNNHTLLSRRGTGSRQPRALRDTVIYDATEAAAVQSAVVAPVQPDVDAPVQPAMVAPVQPAVAAAVQPAELAPIQPAGVAPVQPTGVAPVQPAEAVAVQPAVVAPVS